MIAKELQFRFEHYVLLLIVISSFIAAFRIAPNGTARIGLSILLGGAYFIWGLWTHRREIKTIRLVLEYLCVALLGASILIVLSQTL